MMTISWILGTLASLFILWTILGNAMVFVSLARFPHLRINSNLLIANLAAGDFLLVLTIMPLSLVNDLTGVWMFGPVMCQAWLVLDVLYCTASIWALVMIALDRFIATNYPIRYRQLQSDSMHHRRLHRSGAGVGGGAAVFGGTSLCCCHNKLMTLNILLVWLLSMITSGPPAYVQYRFMQRQPDIQLNVTTTPTSTIAATGNETMLFSQCELYKTPWVVVWSATGSFLMPLVILVVLYTRIFRVLQVRARIARNNQQLLHQNHQHAHPHRHSATPNAEPRHSWNVIRPCQLLDRPSITPTSAHQQRSSFIQSSSSAVASQATTTANNLEMEWPMCNTVDEEKQEKQAKQATSNKNLLSSYDNKNSMRLSVRGGGIGFAGRQRHKHNQNEDGGDGNNNNTSSSSGRFTRSRKSLRQNIRAADHREQRATLRMALVIALFVACWIPFTLMYLIRSLTTISRISHRLQIGLVWLGYFNSGLNPILYTLFNAKFRRAFVRILTDVFAVFCCSASYSCCRYCCGGGEAAFQKQSRSSSFYGANAASSAHPKLPGDTLLLPEHQQTHTQIQTQNLSVSQLGCAQDSLNRRATVQLSA